MIEMLNCTKPSIDSMTGGIFKNEYWYCAGLSLKMNISSLKLTLRCTIEESVVPAFSQSSSINQGCGTSFQEPRQLQAVPFVQGEHACIQEVAHETRLPTKCAEQMALPKEVCAESRWHCKLAGQLFVSVWTECAFVRGCG